MEMVAIDVVELEKSMKRNVQTLGRNPKKNEPCTIHKVFLSVRREHGEDYDPKIIAIGPFHHNKDSLKPMELLKWRYLRQLLRRNLEKNTLQNYINVINEAKTAARNYYSEPVEVNDNLFVEMMVLDGGFLIEYLVKAYTGDNEQYLNAVTWNLPLLRADLLLLENQIPFPILQLLFDSSDIPDLLGLKKDGTAVTLTELAVTYVTRNKLETLPEASKPDTIHHLLHVYHASIHPTPRGEDDLAHRNCGRVMFSTLKWVRSLASAPFLWLLSSFLNCQITFICCLLCRVRRSKEKNPRAPRGIPTATQLQESGVKFMKKSGAISFLDVVFDKEEGIMEIPMLSIQEATVSHYRNLIAFEQCCPKSGSHFTSYATLMNNLVDTGADVAILKGEDIIESKLGEDEEVAELFNNLCKGAYIDFETHDLHQVFKDVVEYANVERHKWRAGLMHNYFGNPWAIISLVAAVFLLCLTVVQTFYAVYAYQRPPPN